MKPNLFCMNETVVPVIQLWPSATAGCMQWKQCTPLKGSASVFNEAEPCGGGSSLFRLQIRAKSKGETKTCLHSSSPSFSQRAESRPGQTCH